MFCCCSQFRYNEKGVEEGEEEESGIHDDEIKTKIICIGTKFKEREGGERKMNEISPVGRIVD